MMTTEVTAQLDANLEAICRSTDLHALELIIAKGKATFVEVGLALWRVREAKLYKLTHSTWEAWIRDRWWASKRYADRQIAAARFTVQMGTVVPIATEHQAHVLSTMPEDERDEVLEQAQELAGSGDVEPEHVAEAIRQTKAKPPSLQNRRTPLWLFSLLDARFGPFRLDAFASPEDALLDRYYTRETDGLTQAWLDVTFGNPEFKTMMPAALEHAVHEAERGIRSVILGPVGCSQEWFHQWAIRGTIYAPDRRISFDMPDGTPTEDADRDTIVMAFGGEHVNLSWRKGRFRVLRIELPPG